MYALLYNVHFFLETSQNNVVRLHLQVLRESEIDGLKYQNE